MNDRGQNLPFVPSSRSDLLLSRIFEHSMSLFDLFDFRLKAYQVISHWLV